MEPFNLIAVLLFILFLLHYTIVVQAFSKWSRP